MFSRCLEVGIGVRLGHSPVVIEAGKEKYTGMIMKV